MSKVTDNMPKVSLANTKKEMLDAYNQLLKKFEERAAQELQPEKAKAEKQKHEVVQLADEMANKDVTGQVDVLKTTITRQLVEIADKMVEQAQEYLRIKEAIAAKEQELKEIFDIERAAFSLSALLEANRRKKEDLEQEMADRREKLKEEIDTTRADWTREKAEYVAARTERKKEDEKQRKREEEEYKYAFNRKKEQQLHLLQDELATLKKEMADAKEEHDRQVRDKEKELQEREETVTAREKHVNELQQQVESFPGTLDSELQKATSGVTAQLTADAAKNEELLRKTLEGEKNVLQTKIQALEQTVAEQRKQIASISAQLENAYGKVQDIAVKAVSASQERRSQEVGSRPATDQHSSS